MKDYSDYGIDVPFGKRNGKIKTICPQCHELRTDKRDKSLSVDLDKGVWNCHYCGWSGCLEHTDEERRQWAELHRPHRVRSATSRKEYRKPEEKPHGPVGEKVMAWLEGRGISRATVEAMRITDGVEWMPPGKGERKEGKRLNTVQFNYYLGGVLVNTKYRSADKAFKMVSGARLVPYNIDAIKGTEECIITEGEMDALSFYEIGRHDVVSVPAGANANLDYLDDFIESHFEDKKTIYIAVDTDAKGVLLRDELVRRFGPEVCRIVEYGEDCKDANERLMKYGRESLRRCLEMAAEIKVEGIFTVSDFEASLDAIYEFGLQKGVTIGHDNIDRLISFETRRLCVVTGYPGSGKSEFIDEMAERLNMSHGWRFAYFSPENAPLAYHGSKLVEKISGRKFDRQHLPQAQYERVKAYMEDNFFFILPDDYRLDTILEKARYLVRRKGIKALVIDPYNRLEDERGTTKETDYVSRVLDRLTQFAVRNDVLVILMAHPAKPPKGKTDPPTLYDISGSANFFNKTDFGIVVHRDRATQTVQIRVEKVKFKHLGEPGVAFMKYNLNNGRYTPYIEGQEPVWDNTDHLAEEERRRAREIADAARFNDDEWMTPVDEVPF